MDINQNFATASQMDPIPSTPVLNSVKTPLDANSEQEINAGTIDESMLSEEERKALDAYADKIDISDVTSIINYGSSAQDNISNFSVEILSKVQTNDLGEIGASLRDLTVAIDATADVERKGIRGALKKRKDGITRTVRANYAKAESNVDSIEKDLQKHMSVLTEDIAMYQEMYDLNIQYYKELTMYILAGKKALAKARNGKLQELKNAAESTNQQVAIQTYKDFEDQCYRFEKKLETLEMTRVISMQSAPQVRMLQNNDRELLDKLQASISNTIPLWRNQLVISLGIDHTKKALKAQSLLADKTNELLMKNSEALKSATIGTARETERPIIDLSTLEKCNRDLITSLNEVLKVHDHGSQQRAQIQGKLTEIERELKQALFESGETTSSGTYMQTSPFRIN